MDEFKVMSLMIVIAGIAGFGLISLMIVDTFILDNEETIEGVIIDSEYSQSGFGSSDITVLYFEDGRTIIFTETIEIDRNKLLKIVYKDYQFLKGNGFVSVEYL